MKSLKSCSDSHPIRNRQADNSSERRPPSSPLTLCFPAASRLLPQLFSSGSPPPPAFLRSGISLSHATDSLSHETQLGVSLALRTLIWHRAARTRTIREQMIYTQSLRLAADRMSRRLSTDRCLTEI